MIGRRDCALLTLALPARSGGVNSARCRSPTWPKTSAGAKPPGREKTLAAELPPSVRDYRVGRCTGGLRLGCMHRRVPWSEGLQAAKQHPSWRPAPYRDASSWSRSVSLIESHSVSLTVSTPRYFPRTGV